MKHSFEIYLWRSLVVLFLGCGAYGSTDVVMMTPSADDGGITAYTNTEVQRIFLEHLKVKLEPSEKPDRAHDLIALGTVRNNRWIKRLVDKGFVRDIETAQGYSMRCAPDPRNKDRWILAILGADECGVLYGLRDLEHYYLKHFKISQGKLRADSFAVADYPRIEYRGHWVWGCNMPDKKAWMENMSRWKLNELIHWDNYPPKKAKEYVDFAHSRGIRVIWGFGWGWNPDWNFAIPAEFDHGMGKGVQMCGSSEFNRDYFQREILRKVRELYVPSGCDGIYFQAFTEVPKCQCQSCNSKSKGQIMLEFVNPIVAAIKKEFPDLWISCGVHANLGYYAEMKELDPRCNIYWENCDSGTSIRGEYEDFGYINKTLPYAHGFSKTCPADPAYTEASLQAWMRENQKRYTLAGTLDSYDAYMRTLQQWGRNFLGKKSVDKHGSTVADHSVFCRRTPFMHIALAEAQWNPDMDTEARVDAIVDFLDIGVRIKKLGAAVTVQHEAVGKAVTLKTPCASKYTAGGAEGLVNGRISSRKEVGEGCWQGYEGDDFEAVIDLGTVHSIRSLDSGYLQSINAGVFLPSQVQYTLSNDGKNFTMAGTVECDVEQTRKETVRMNYSLKGLDLDGRYVRVKALNIKVIPDWHKAKGRKSWLFVDEIMVNPVMIHE